MDTLSLYAIVIIFIGFPFTGLLFTNTFIHLIHRYILYKEGAIPIKYVTFLQHITKTTGLLENNAEIKKLDGSFSSGGEWRFKHKLIQDNLTEKYEESYGKPVT